MKDPLVEHISSNWNAQASAIALWVLFPLFHWFSCWGTPDSSAKFTQRSGRDEVGWRRNEERRLGEVAEVAEFWLQRPPTLALSAPAGASSVYTSKSALLDFFQKVFYCVFWLFALFCIFQTKTSFFQVHVHHGSRSMQHRAVSLWRSFTCSEGGEFQDALRQ